LIIIVGTYAREDVHDIEKELLIVDIAIGVILHSRICVHE
jgi:hypothetical protein